MCFWGCLLSAVITKQCNVSNADTQGSQKKKLAFRRRKNFAQQLLFVRNHSWQATDFRF